MGPRESPGGSRGAPSAGHDDDWPPRSQPGPLTAAPGFGAVAESQWPRRDGKGVPAEGRRDWKKGDRLGAGRDG